MALSGSYDFTLNRNAMINAALRLIGVGRRGETLTHEEMEDASEALNLMLKAWQAEGLQLWKRTKLNIPLVGGQSSYALGLVGADVTTPRPLRILECNRKDKINNITTPLYRMSQKEYYALPNRAQEGIPVSFYFDPTLTNSTFYVWSTPSAAEAANWEIELTYHAPVDDVDIGTDDIDCPPEWLEAVKFGLATRLAPEYDLPMVNRKYLEEKFAVIFDRALTWDMGDEGLFIEPQLRDGRDN